MKKIIKAPAKINLYLRVNSKMEDGYHDLTMIMQPISLFDTISIEIFSNLKCQNCNNFENQVNLTSNLPYIPTDDKNLVVKVIKHFFDKYSIKDRISVHLNKFIPTCGGLGGGSSDAASMILFLNDYYKTNLSLDDMNKIACLYGADIPFFLYKKECICEGKGEIITALTTFKNYYVLIATPNVRVSTKDIFNAVDNSEFKYIYDNQNNEMFDNCVKAIKNRDLKSLSNNIYNDLEKVTCELYSDVSVIKNSILDCGAINALMSGSGPTVFGIFSSFFKALNAKKEIKSRFNDAFIYLARPL